MHVGGITVDLNWFVQFIFTVFVIALGLLHLVKNTASKYFEVDANFEGNADPPPNHAMVVPMETQDSVCANCANPASKKCSRCKSVRYCSPTCQEAHWKSGHKSKCKVFGSVNSTQTPRTNFGFKASCTAGKTFSGIALVPASGTFKPIKKPKKVLFPYDEFIRLYNSKKPGFAPCGLLNCGNSCFANVVLQCLTYTQPLVTYLLDKGHQRDCRRNDWCFLCVFQAHVERASQSSLPFSPINILSRLPNIGGNLGYGRQEDAHEFMRFAIDTMQSVCLDEFGGEKAVDPASQETTLIQHIFGGHLQSQVICTQCNKISNQFENMMDLTVEIQGDAASLEECLDQFTAKEWLLGENMYKCDGCNDYVKAGKRLTIRQAPNILTIALKRFQSGRFGKLNKRVTFPETLDLGPYMSDEGDGTDVYRLYAVVVHVDMLNASFFGHYICYTKDFDGNWYRIDDCKVACVELEEVLSQGAYMLLYSRVSARPSCLRAIEPSKEQQPIMKLELDSCAKERVECLSALESTDAMSTSGSLASENNSEVISKRFEDVVVNFESSSAGSKGVSSGENESSSGVGFEDVRDAEDMNRFNSELCSTATGELSSCNNDVSVAFPCGTVGEDPENMNAIDSDVSSSVSFEVSGREKDSSAAIDSEVDVIEYSGNTDLVNPESSSAIVMDIKVNGSMDSFPSKATSVRTYSLKRESPFIDLNGSNGNGAKRAEITDSY